MTTFTHPEGLVITYTNKLLEAILLQLNSSNIYYTSGEHGIRFVKISSNSIWILGYTYFINRNIFQNYTINGNTVNDYNS